MVEVPGVRELVTEGVDQARIFEGSTRGGVEEPDLDGVIGEANPVAASHPGALRFESPIAQAEMGREALGVSP